MIYDQTCCTLGEGALWHPLRKEFYWFDILGKRLHAQGRHWEFDTYVSAAGWTSESQLMIASATGLHLFDIASGRTDDLCPMEAENTVTRSNDGRADPYGGYWIGTMGIGAEEDAGAIYRYYRGELRQLYAPITIPNAICFTPDGSTGFFADTHKATIWKVALGEEGWPKGDPEVFLDLSGEGLRPDGSVIDAAGNMWNAQWQSGRVAVYAPTGHFLTAIGFPALQTTCPAFGGEDLSTLFCTSAAEGLQDPLNPHHGRTFAIETGAQGQAEHRVIL
ncbi:SMP-30/gluconolactonase/LRE family protein [Histidinibacterium aquaticum]|uniref:SMP-30/gluconolactonase/LRE family protein n=1 Tax=Histidinibacterium aquaticum TaxID=2613962 RepID=A0A5J5GII5_9RHOB|nr:SMP-30/gluconolactonase/LRE family protein [Histidinibacterium aquaticum]KAA9007985.1 SMP-30/gluconolactonase/LRE family protein [Histidinibacterium aquaticum]